MAPVRSVLCVAVLFVLNSTKVPTPLTAATDVVPLSVAPPGLFPSVIATAPPYPVARLPKASSARTFTAGLMGLSATVVLRSEERRVGEEGRWGMATGLFVIAVTPGALTWRRDSVP